MKKQDLIAVIKTYDTQEQTNSILVVLCTIVIWMSIIGGILGFLPIELKQYQMRMIGFLSTALVVSVIPHIYTTVQSKNIMRKRIDYINALENKGEILYGQEIGKNKLDNIQKDPLFEDIELY